MYCRLLSSDGEISGNGGHPSLCQAATNGAFSPDRGRQLVPNPIGDNMEREFFNSNEHLIRSDRSLDRIVSDAAHIQSRAGDKHYRNETTTQAGNKSKQGTLQMHERREEWGFTSHKRPNSSKTAEVEYESRGIQAVFRNGILGKHGNSTAAGKEILDSPPIHKT